MATTLLCSTLVQQHVTQFSTEITAMQRTVKLDSQDVALLDSVGFTIAYDARNDDTVLIAESHDDVHHIAEQFDVVKYVGERYVSGSEIALGEN